MKLLVMHILSIIIVVLVPLLQMELSEEVVLRHLHRVAHNLAPTDQEAIDEEGTDEGDAG